MSKTPTAPGKADGNKSESPSQQNPTSHKIPETPIKGKAHSPLPGGCFCVGCKAQATRFNFCEEHYDHFKFGLIKKSGEPVPDYEKKFEHYLAFKAKRGSHKVA